MSYCPLTRDKTISQQHKINKQKNALKAILPTFKTSFSIIIQLLRRSIGQIEYP